MKRSLVRLTQTALLTAFLTAPASAQAPALKLDESLREALERGCVGAQSVIITMEPGYREGLRASLTAHGDVVTGEFPALDAVAATIHCDDLSTLADFVTTRAVSANANVGVSAAARARASRNGSGASRTSPPSARPTCACSARWRSRS